MSATTPFRILPATEHDLATIRRMILGLAEHEKLSHVVRVTEDNLQAALFGASKCADVILGYVGDEPVGFALYYHTFATFQGQPCLFVEDLFVEARWRGHGVGKRLLAHLAQMAVARGCQRIEWCALDWNAQAMAFYRSLGAEQHPECVVHMLKGEALAQLADA